MSVGHLIGSTQHETACWRQRERDAAAISGDALSCHEVSPHEAVDDGRHGGGRHPEGPGKLAVAAPPALELAEDAVLGEAEPDATERDLELVGEVCRAAPETA